MGFDLPRANKLLNEAAKSCMEIEPDRLDRAEPLGDVLGELATLAGLPDELTSEARMASDLAKRMARGETDLAEGLDAIGEAVAVLLEAVETEARKAPVLAPVQPMSRSADGATGQLDQCDDPLVPEFVAEALEHLQSAEESLLKLEQHPGDADALNTVLRAFHTVKGSAGIMRLRRIGEFAHGAEALLVSIRDGGIVPDRDVLGTCFKALDTLKGLVHVLGTEKGKGELPPSYHELMGRLAALRGGEPAAAAREAPVEAAPATAPPAAENRRQDPDPGGPESGHVPTKAHTTIRVTTERLDDLVDLVGELVIAHAMVNQELMTLLGDDGRELRSLNLLGKATHELQTMALSLRMVPLRDTFQRAARAIRDLASRSGKKVVFTVVGEDTRLDRHMVEKLADPLIHMLRNAVDHGVEPPEERRGLGKPEEGHVQLLAFHKGGNVVIQLHDDGRGMDRQAILAKALRTGLVTEESAKELDDPAVFEFIFCPGFSTAKEVSEVSGRGVGMDVVRKNIESLHGFVDAESSQGKGTSFTIRLPLTLAIIDGMVVRTGRQRYIIPTLSVERFARPEPGQVVTVEGRGEAITDRGRVLPVHRLHRIFDIPAAVADPCAGILVVIAGEGDGCAFLVDELLGQQQVVIKNLGSVLGNTPGISGAAILGDGTVGLILDIPGLIRLARETAGLLAGQGKPA